MKQLYFHVFFMNAILTRKYNLKMYPNPLSDLTNVESASGRKTKNKVMKINGLYLVQGHLLTINTDTGKQS